MPPLLLAATIALPAGETADAWADALALAHLSGCPASDGCSVTIRVEGGMWVLRVPGTTRQAEVDAPETARDREAVALLAASLTRSGPTVPVPDATGATGAAGAAPRRLATSGRAGGAHGATGRSSRLPSVAADPVPAALSAAGDDRGGTSTPSRAGTGAVAPSDGAGTVAGDTARSDGGGEAPGDETKTAGSAPDPTPGAGIGEDAPSDGGGDPEDHRGGTVARDTVLSDGGGGAAHHLAGSAGTFPSSPHRGEVARSDGGGGATDRTEAARSAGGGAEVDKAHRDRFSAFAGPLFAVRDGLAPAPGARLGVRLHLPVVTLGLSAATTLPVAPDAGPGTLRSVSAALTAELPGRRHVEGPAPPRIGKGPVLPPPGGGGEERAGGGRATHISPFVAIGPTLTTWLYDTGATDATVAIALTPGATARAGLDLPLSARWRVELAIEGGADLRAVTLGHAGVAVDELSPLWAGGGAFLQFE